MNDDEGLRARQAEATQKGSYHGLGRPPRPCQLSPSSPRKEAAGQEGGAGEERRPAGTLGTQRRKLRELAQACWTPRRKYLSQNRS